MIRRGGFLNSAVSPKKIRRLNHVKPIGVKLLGCYIMLSHHYHCPKIILIESFLINTKYHPKILPNKGYKISPSHSKMNSLVPKARNRPQWNTNSPAKRCRALAQLRPFQCSNAGARTRRTAWVVGSSSRRTLVRKSLAMRSPAGYHWLEGKPISRPGRSVKLTWDVCF